VRAIAKRSAAALEERVEAAPRGHGRHAFGRSASARAARDRGEQLSVTGFELADLIAQLAPEASSRPGTRSSGDQGEDRTPGAGEILRPSENSRSSPSARNISTDNART